VHGILVHLPGDGNLRGILCQEVYTDKDKAAWVGMMIQDGKAMEALGENGKPFKVVPEGTTVKLIPLTLIWDVWEDKPEVENVTMP